MHIHEFRFRSIQGASLSLERWTSQPILLVNTASESQFAPQLRKLQALYQEYMPSGLIVLGIPCNEFGEKEPLDGQDLDTYYWENHGVNFPVTEKQAIIGRGAHPLFIEMREEYTNEIMPQGNFYKYLFGREGQLLQHWPSIVEPDDPGLRHQIERNVSAWCL
ncbi:MAG: glutathione peroxidase [Xanthomonadales bacterium]|jgi:glutathione peroxidase|nr:glutathione peroxidase [Xanthomonadales bacterium]